MVKAALSELAIIHEKLPEVHSHANVRAQEISEISQATAKELKICAQHIEAFQVGNQSFIEIMAKLNDAFLNLKYIALNMTVSAAKYGEKVSSLGVVAKEFSNLSGQIQDHLSGLTNFIDTLKQLSTQCALRIVSLEVQMLMVVFFINESIAKMKDSEHAFAEMNENRHNFSDLFSEYALALKAEMQNLRTQMQSVSSEMAEIRKFITGLEVICQIGAVESSRENEVKQTFAHYLDEMRRFISLLQTSTSSIQREILDMNERSELIMDTADNLANKVESIFELAANIEA